MSTDRFLQPEATSYDFLTGGGEMGARMRAHDWDNTPLGSPATWPQSLRSALSICLGSSFQIAIYWGPELALLYNDAWSQIPGQKHPWALGRPGREVWPEIWDTIGPMFGRVLTKGEATLSRDQLLAMHRRGFIEECYFDYTFSPIRDEAGGVGGIFNIAVETTFRVIGERRTRLLKDLGELTNGARTPQEACILAAKAMATDPADLPFCLIYLKDLQSADTLSLTGITGLSAGHAAAPLTLNSSAPDAPWLLAPAGQTESPLLVENLGTRFGLPFPGGPWPAPCERALVVPLPHVGSGEAAGALVAGISPRLVLDAEYQAFIDRVAGLTATTIANARAYEEERKRAEALAELDRAKTAFFSNVSHEFRTPLTLMLGPIEDILAKAEGQVYPENRELLQLVHRSGLRLQRLVNTLLDFSRIEAGRAEAAYEQTDLATFTAELASTFRSAMERAGLTFTVACSPVSLPVYVDREMWEKVVLNLLSNAFKYTLEGSVVVRLTEREAAAEFSITDTGSGIPAQELPRLFERFHRIEGTRARTHEGTGIGLALVQELVKLHGGTVRVESAVGSGTTFTVVLPLGKAHLPSERIGRPRTLLSTAVIAEAFVEEALRWLPNAPEPLAAGDLGASSDLLRGGSFAAQTARVLLADDNADMRDYVKRLLSAHYGVEEVTNGRDALNRALADPPDLVLTDVMMPELDGLGLLQALRSDARTRTVPVILLSARAGEEARSEGMNAGADDYLVKPFSSRELLARVGAHIRLGQARKEAFQAVHESEERFRAYVTASSDVIYRMSTDWSEMRHLQGRGFITNTEHPTRDWLKKYIHPDDQPGVLAAIQHAVDTKTPFELEHRIVRVDGTLGWTFSRAIPLLDSHGNIVEWFGAARDVTERKQADEELRRFNEELRRANRELEEFAYVASHDLQEPLRMVNIYTQLLLREWLPEQEKAQGCAIVIRKAVKRMEELIQDLLSYSRAVHKAGYENGIADLSESLSQALTNVDARVKETKARVTAGTLPRVRGDTTQYAHVFQNLLSNSLKYRRDEIVPEVHITAKQLEREVIITVCDNGIGFEQKYAEQIFGLFKRLHRDEYPGTGLGLAICQRIIERYGGRMWAAGKPGEGAAFSFSVPTLELD